MIIAIELVCIAVTCSTLKSMELVYLEGTDSIPCRSYNWLTRRYPHTFLRQYNWLTRLELDRYIGTTHHRGRLWDNRNHRNHGQMMTIGDQSVPMFHDDVTH